MASKVTEVSIEDRELNYAELDALAESAGLIENAYTRVLPDAYLKSLKTAAGILARYGNKVTLAEIVVSETSDLRYRSEWSPVEKIMSELYPVWVDKDAIVAREDNLLTSPEVRIGWEDEFARGAARTICDSGTIVGSDGKPFGFGYTADRKIVAAFEVTEDTWYDEGFGEEDTEYKGFATEVMLDDGTFGIARFEGSISELMMAILSRALRK